MLERPEHPISRRDIDANVLKVLYRLINADHIAYLVGGGVRDLMLGRRPKDFDVATSAHPHEIRALFRNSRLIGRRFRLVHVFFGANNIEVATFRRGADRVDDDDLLIRHDNTFPWEPIHLLRRKAHRVPIVAAGARSASKGINPLLALRAPVAVTSAT